ncbi:MAG: DEAD/DEAH box helicase, partial [Propionibacteriaceae bacterium]|nr:DEAD/DEAH box helicase [Propionibacteriaceae bacterium]
MATLSRFSLPAQTWFRENFASPTAAQEQAWEAVSNQENALVVAPTGSGKTLAAFLWAIDRLASPANRPDADALRPGVRVLYVSPLKALAVDVERNLRSPLRGIQAAARELGLDPPSIRVGVRTGDTPPAERRQFTRKPPDILITTPESLFLLLTSAARSALASVETVIVDEVHAVAGSKRGAHLSLSLERLDELLPRPAQRIGLSATVRPMERVARFLSGTRPTQIIAPQAQKEWRIEVVVPVPDMAEIGAESEPETQSIWPAVEERIVDLIEEHRSTLVFTNSRRLAEKLTVRITEIHAARTAERDAIAAARDGEAIEHDGKATEHDFGAAARDGEATEHDSSVPEHEDGTPWRSGDAAGGAFARAHHGSVSHEQRAQIEEDLKAGRLRAVVATSSLELGIDMGAIDLVIQVEAPVSVASGLQRIGRAGHQVQAVSHGMIFPKFRGDLLQTAVVVQRMLSGAIEEVRVPSNPLDVLAQQIVAMAAMDDWRVDDLEKLVRRSANFAQLTRDVLESLLDMLTGRYPSDEFAELRPRINWDRGENLLTGRRGAQHLAVTSGGTIPDRGLYGVFLAEEAPSAGQALAPNDAAQAGPDGTTPSDRGVSRHSSSRRGGRRVGELDEEMVYESRVGDVFALGTSSWRIAKITHDQVIVTPAPGVPARMPFWHGDAIGRPAELGEAVGAFVRRLDSLPQLDAKAELASCGLDEWAADNLLAYLSAEKRQTGHLPTDRQLVVQRSRDEVGDWRVVVLSPYGGQVHAPWALLAASRLRERFGADVRAMHADDGMVFRIPDTSLDWEAGEWSELDDRALLADIFPDPADIVSAITAQLGDSALFASRFREAANRALLLPKRRPDQRRALWQQRLQAAQLLEVANAHPSFPIIMETVRECLNDVFDVPALERLLSRVRSGAVRTVSVTLPQPSPFTSSLLLGYMAAFLYEYDSPLAERRAAALCLDPQLLAQLLGQVALPALAELLEPEQLTRTEAELQHLAEPRKARDADELTDLLRMLGPLTTAQLAARCQSPPDVADWLAGLVRQRRVGRVDLSPGIAASLEEEGQPSSLTVPEQTRRLRSSASKREESLGTGGARPTGSQSPTAWGTQLWTAAEDLADPPSVERWVLRYARSHVPFTRKEVGAWLRRLAQAGLTDRAASLEHQLAPRLAGLVADGRLVEGELRPVGWTPPEPPRALCAEDALPRGTAATCANPEVGDVQWDTPHMGDAPYPASLSADIPSAAASSREDAQAATHSADAPHDSASSRSNAAREPWAVDSSTVQYCDPNVLQTLRRRSIAALRKAVEPVPAAQFARFLPQWHEFGARRGSAGVLRTIEQLAGVPLAASAWETLILPARVCDYQPAMLDELLGAGEICWQGNGALASGDGWISFHLRDSASLTLHPGPPAATSAGSGSEALDLLAQSALFAPDLAARMGWSLAKTLAELWELAWAGLVSNDSFAGVRALLKQGTQSHRTQRTPLRSRYGRPRLRLGHSADPSPHAGGRWWAIPAPDTDPTRRAVAITESLLDRYPVLTKPSVTAEGIPGGFATVYRVLSAAEDAGQLRRGYFIEGLGGAQFAPTEVIDRLREEAQQSTLDQNAPKPGHTSIHTANTDVPVRSDQDTPRPMAVDSPAALSQTLTLAACDPANPYGAALPWPLRQGGHLPGRKPGALVTMVAGRLVLYVERGGRTALTWPAEPAALTAAAASLSALITRQAAGDLTIEKVDGEPILSANHPLATALSEAGFKITPRGYTL